MNLPRPCLDCGRLTRNPTRCGDCARTNSRTTWAKRGKGQRYRSAGWEQQSKVRRAQHLEVYGPICPGWARPPHACAPAALVVDHDIGVCCRSCNAVKAATVDKDRARWARSTSRAAIF
jgi:5-methylcytosine-specific restriction enzyme A